jgi:F0F1-type ATP synthase membrane subunit c/vacuolar-type H+-ATPase subunit K
MESAAVSAALAGVAPASGKGNVFSATLNTARGTRALPGKFRRR